MKKLFPIIAVVIFLFSCSNNNKEKVAVKDNKVSLHTDTVNTVKLSDTLVIYESTCRGCAYENSTDFEIKDSLGIVKLLSIVTTDNNTPDMNGGSISKTLVLVPVKTGTTTIKLFKYYGQKTTAADSARFTPYTIQVQN
jgi:hypothetical protein